VELSVAPVGNYFLNQRMISNLFMENMESVTARIRLSNPENSVAKMIKHLIIIFKLLLYFIVM
jgi:hypothetical protein